MASIGCGFALQPIHIQRAAPRTLLTILPSRLITKRPQFGAGRDLGPPERREGGSRRLATADHIHLAADVQF
jgi:hypothetical protein